MNKDDEQILVIKSGIIFKMGAWQGLKTENLDYYIDLIKNNREFKRRGDVENDTSFQQIIPYIVFNFKDKYFIYKYLPKAGEQRLVDTYQLGIGGHINQVDGQNGNALEEGMMREWTEEVEFRGNLVSKKLVGIINDDSRPVEQVHIGLVYRFTGDTPEIFIKETEKMQGRLVDLQDIAEYIKGNDGVWVKIVYRDYLSRLLPDRFLKSYQEFCKTTAKKFDDPEKEIMTWGLGVSGEAGDLAGCIKKTFSHKNDQKPGIKENLGDTLWYIAAICSFFGWNLDEVFKENMDKLNKRYPEGFTDKDAGRNNTRVDWNEEK